MELCDKDSYPSSKNFKAVWDIRQWDQEKMGVQQLRIKIMTATLELLWMTVPSGAVCGHRGCGSRGAVNAIPRLDNGGGSHRSQGLGHLLTQQP